MTPQITVSQSLFDDIKSIADPFKDTTPEAAIRKAVDFYRQNYKGTGSGFKSGENQGINPALNFPADGAPDLRFTKPISVKLDGKPVAKAMLYWNAVMFELVKIAAEKLPPEALRQAILVNFVEGEGAKEKGYRFFTEAGLSVQGQDANQAWRAIVHLAKVLHISIHVTMTWEANDKAAYSGQTGQMSYQAV